jgi:hypothetical protein
MSDEQAARLDAEIDPAKRDTLKKLGRMAWAIPVVTTFAVGGLSMSSAWSAVSNGTKGARHS